MNLQTDQFNSSKVVKDELIHRSVHSIQVKTVRGELTSRSVQFGQDSDG
jgi:hypothetical protein